MEQFKLIVTVWAGLTCLVCLFMLWMFPRLGQKEIFDLPDEHLKKTKKFVLRCLYFLICWLLIFVCFCMYYYIKC